MSFLPCLGVSNPSQMGLFVKNLMQCATFNLDDFNNFSWVLKFTRRAPSAFGMERIGIVDRAIFHRTGYLIHVIAGVYFFWAIGSFILSRPRMQSIRGVRRLTNVLGVYNHKAKLMMFLWVIYLQLFIGSMINWDNTRLFDVAANWGVKGHLLFGDQINTIFGFLAFGVCIFLPISIYYALKQNYYQIHYTDLKSEDMPFSELNNCLTDITPPIQSYFLAVLARRFLFGLIAYCMGGMVFSTFTVLLNIILSMCFVVYLFKVNVFED